MENTLKFVDIDKEGNTVCRIGGTPLSKKFDSVTQYKIETAVAKVLEENTGNDFIINLEI